MKKTILIVDDFENTRWVIEFTLKNQNFEILKATNGKEALAYFDGRKIDLLLTDLNMPEMDGIELIKEVKNIPEYRKLPVILLTTEKSSVQRERAMELNITAWIQKPFKTETFLKVVRKSLNIK